MAVDRTLPGQKVGGKERGSRKSMGLKNWARAWIYAGWCLVNMKLNGWGDLSLIIERTETQNCYFFLVCCVDVMMSYTKNKPLVSQEVVLKLQKLMELFSKIFLLCRDSLYFELLVMQRCIQQGSWRCRKHLCCNIVSKLKENMGQFFRLFWGCVHLHIYKWQRNVFRRLENLVYGIHLSIMLCLWELPTPLNR